MKSQTFKMYRVFHLKYYVDVTSGITGTQMISKIFFRWIWNNTNRGTPLCRRFLCWCHHQIETLWLLNKKHLMNLTQFSLSIDICYQLIAFYKVIQFFFILFYPFYRILQRIQCWYGSFRGHFIKFTAFFVSLFYFIIVFAQYPQL